MHARSQSILSERIVEDIEKKKDKRKRVRRTQAEITITHGSIPVRGESARPQKLREKRKKNPPWKKKVIR